MTHDITPLEYRVTIECPVLGMFPLPDDLSDSTRLRYSQAVFHAGLDYATDFEPPIKLDSAQKNHPWERMSEIESNLLAVSTTYSRKGNMVRLRMECGSRADLEMQHRELNGFFYYVAANVLRHVCANCGEENWSRKLLKCGCCERTRYCDSKCQREHWKAGHNHHCTKSDSNAPWKLSRAH